MCYHNIGKIQNKTKHKKAKIPISMQIPPKKYVPKKNPELTSIHSFLYFKTWHNTWCKKKRNTNFQMNESMFSILNTYMEVCVYTAGCSWLSVFVSPQQSDLRESWSNSPGLPRMFRCKVSAAESDWRTPHSPSTCPSGLQGSDFCRLRDQIKSKGLKSQNNPFFSAWFSLSCE